MSKKGEKQRVKENVANSEIKREAWKKKMEFLRLANEGKIEELYELARFRYMVKRDELDYLYDRLHNFWLENRIPYIKGANGRTVYSYFDWEEHPVEKRNVLDRIERLEESIKSVKKAYVIIRDVWMERTGRYDILGEYSENRGI